MAHKYKKGTDNYNTNIRDFPEDVYGELGSKERRIKLQKNSQLKSTYGLTFAAYDAMLKSQKCCCAICGEEEAGVQKRKYGEVKVSLSVDHDHATGKIRALLCHKCNKALGLLKEDPKILRAALDYLIRHSGGL